MPSTLANFTLGNTTNIQSDDFVVGYDTAVLGGERRWTVSTLANAVSGIMSTQLGNVFVEESIFTGANQSLAVSGYQRLPGGLIIQWINASTVNALGVVNFPIAFPNAFFIAVVSEGNAGGWMNSHTVYGETGSSNTQLQIVGYTVENGGAIQTAGTINFNCIAIGY